MHACLFEVELDLDVSTWTCGADSLPSPIIVTFPFLPLYVEIMMWPNVGQICKTECAQLQGFVSVQHWRRTMVQHHADSSSLVVWRRLH